MKFFKKLKAKGFTLIELIATIALLAIIALISFVSVNAVINKNKEKQYKNLVSSIKIAAKQYASENKYSDDFLNKTTVTIPLSKLVDKGYISSPVIDPYTNKEIDNLPDIMIVLYLDTGEVKNVKINGMPVHGDISSDPEIDNQGEIVNNDDNNNNNNNNNDGNNNNNNNTQTYKLTFSCESDFSSGLGGCRFANDIANYTVTVDVAPGTVIDLTGDRCYCGKGYYYQNAWYNVQAGQPVSSANFTMPDHDVTLLAVYGQ